jgi:hypothetical protein
MSAEPVVNRPTPNEPGLRPEDLPPVTPPSAGFIVQLFLIPAFIVMAVVAVWALFGKMAESQDNWQELTADLGNTNEHRRWRAALGLAQMLHNEQIAPPNDREPLARNPAVVESLTSLFSNGLDDTTPTDAEITNLEFLARMLGALEADDKTLPVLARGIAADQSLPVRRSALMALTVIAERRLTERENGPAESGTPGPLLTEPEVLEQLRRGAQDPEPAIRHLSAYCLATVGGESALSQLQVMLLDGDRFARANAAVGLARNKRSEGATVLLEFLASADQPFDESSVSGLSRQDQVVAKANYPGEQARLVRNCLKAVEEIWPQLSAEQQAEALRSATKIAESFTAADVRLQASAMIRDIQNPDPKLRK